MANWVIRCSDEWLKPIYNLIHEKLIKYDTIHMDEIRIQVNKEEGKKASSQSWMWVIQSGVHEAIKATFFPYPCTRGSSVPQKLLNGFSGYLTTDAYIGYDKAEGIKRNLCWAHCRRYFAESILLDNNGKEIPGSKGAAANAVLYTLIETVRANKLNVYEYLSYLLTVMPNTDFRNYSEKLNAYLPWVEELLQKCRLIHTTKKCLK